MAYFTQWTSHTTNPQPPDGSMLQIRMTDHTRVCLVWCHRVPVARYGHLGSASEGSQLEAMAAEFGLAEDEQPKAE
jgi:hypothetical protein